MKNQDRGAGYNLLKTATLVPFCVLKSHVETNPDGESLYVRAEIQFGDKESQGDGSIDSIY